MGGGLTAIPGVIYSTNPHTLLKSKRRTLLFGPVDWHEMSHNIMKILVKKSFATSQGIAAFNYYKQQVVFNLEEVFIFIFHDDSCALFE